jgi:hypothetical protein
VSDRARNTGPMLASRRCGAKTRTGGACRSPAVHGRKRCRLHGGAAGSGARRANRNARKHGLFAGDAIAERPRIEALLGDARTHSRRQMNPHLLQGDAQKTLRFAICSTNRFASICYTPSTSSNSFFPIPTHQMNCPFCNAVVLPSVERCHVCGADVGFPNVRASRAVNERAALQARLNAVSTAASARGSLAVLHEFGAAVSQSRAVLARSLGDLDAFVKSDNLLYVSFHSQVRAGSRIPEDNEWDAGRTAAESTIHPNYHEKINYTALSLDGFGVLWWGEYSIVLKDAHIETRTSVFEENPFLFCSRHRVSAGKQPPAGYRADWKTRQDLAMAKLSGKITPQTAARKFPPILLDQGTSRGTADFIECHIYGALHRSSIERVIGPRPKKSYDLVIWKSVVAELKRLGAIVEEV